MDKYFEMITYLNTTTDIRSVIYKKLASFTNSRFTHDDIALINKNNNKRFFDSQTIIISVLDYAKNNNKIGVNDFEDLYHLVYQRYIAPIEFNVVKKEEKEEVFVPNHKKN